MRKINLLLFLVICLLGLCACSQEPDAPTIATAAPAQSTTQQANDPTVPETTLSLEDPSWAGVDEQTKAFLTQQFTTFGTWYNLALTSHYISPEFVDPAMFFCLGTDGTCVPFTQEELDLIQQDGYNRLALDGAAHKLDKKRSDEIMRQTFGITTADLTHPEAPRLDLNMFYCQQLDAYCVWSRSIPELEQTFSNVEVKDAKTLQNGDIEIFYGLPEGKEGVVTLTQSDGTWKIRSNLSLSDHQAYGVDYSTREKTPWPQVVPLEISYDDYFSSERIYPKEQDDEPWGWDKYYLACDGENYLIRQRMEPYANITQDLLWVIPNVHVDDGITFRMAMSDYLYGIRGNDIIQMDYWGNIHVLFTDETGSLSKMDPYVVPFLLEDQRVLFFCAGSADHMAIYRTYLPSRQTDLFYDGLENMDELSDGDEWGFPLFHYAYSNFELVWTRENTAFLAHYQSLLDDKDSVLYGPEYESVSEMDWIGRLADREDEDPFLVCYYNAQADTYKESVFGRESSEVTYNHLSALERTPWWNPQPPS